MIVKSSHPLKEKVPDFVIRKNGETTFCYREDESERDSQS